MQKVIKNKGVLYNENTESPNVSLGIIFVGKEVLTYTEIEKGVITEIAKRIKNTNNYKEFEADNLHVSQGWFDSSVSFGEPGFEERETILKGLKTAAASGFTAVGINANTNPVIDSHSDILFIMAR